MRIGNSDGPDLYLIVSSPADFAGGCRLIETTCIVARPRIASKFSANRANLQRKELLAIYRP